MVCDIERRTLGGRAGGDVAALFAELEPRLRAALLPLGTLDEVDDALGDAFEYLCANAERIAAMDNPGGYLYRVAQTRIRRNRRTPVELPPVPSRVEHHVEPGLPAALGSLSEQQRVAVFLIAGVGWKPGEVAEYLEVAETTVRSHYDRGMAKLRQRLGEA